MPREYTASAVVRRCRAPTGWFAEFESRPLPPPPSPYPTNLSRMTAAIHTATKPAFIWYYCCIFPSVSGKLDAPVLRGKARRSRRYRRCTRSPRIPTPLPKSFSSARPALPPFSARKALPPPLRWPSGAKSKRVRPKTHTKNERTNEHICEENTQKERNPIETKGQKTKILYCDKESRSESPVRTTIFCIPDILVFFLYGLNPPPPPAEPSLPCVHDVDVISVHGF